jgi:hypothetical protein
MPEDKPAPAYIGNQAPAPLPNIQVLTDPPPPKKKLPIPLWMIILIVVCFWLSGMATMAVIVLGNKNRALQETAEQQSAPQAVVTVVITETPIPQKTVQTIVDSRRVLTNNQFGYSLDTPALWKTEDMGKQFWTYEEGATSHSDPQPYNFARLLVEYESETKFKIVKWFDLKYPPEFGDKKAPVKRKLYVNKNGVEMLETSVNNPNGRLRYYFVANGQVVSLTFNTTESEEVNTRLSPLYGQIIDSVKILKPATAITGAPTAR